MRSPSGVPTINHSDGEAAAERKRGWFYAAAESERSPSRVQQSTTARARQWRSGSAFRPKRRRQQSTAAKARQRRSGGGVDRASEAERGAVGASVSLRVASALLLRARLQEPTPTIRRNREEMAWTPATERRRRGGEAVKAGGGAARRGPTQPIKLRLIRSSSKIMKS